MTTNPEPVPPIIHAVSGAVGSVISNSLIYPLDLVSTRLQTQKKSADSYNNLLDALKRIINEEGFKAFYTGLGFDNAATFLSNFAYFYAYQYLRDFATARRQKQTGGSSVRLSTVQELAIGAVAGIVSRFFTAPFTSIVVRKQTAGQNGDSEKGKQNADIAEPTAYKLAKQIYKEKGITGFWSGFRASILLTSNPSISFYLLNNLFPYLLNMRSQDIHNSMAKTFLLSATSKSVASTITYPLILAKARLSQDKKYKSWVHVVGSVVKRDGILGLYQGIEGQVTKGFASEGLKMMMKDRVEVFILLLLASLRRKQVSSVKTSV